MQVSTRMLRIRVGSTGEFYLVMFMNYFVMDIINSLYL